MGLPLRKRNIITTWTRISQDAVFPCFCFACQKPETYLCEQCTALIHATEPLITLNKHPSPLIGVIACARYAGLMKELIHAFKYNGVQELALPLAHIIDTALATAVSLHSITYPLFAVPIPLHARRERERGFNQNTLLAHHLSLMITHTPSILKRTSYTHSQTRLKKHERLLNIKVAFCAYPPIPQSGTIVLIDDVITTSATLQEAAQCLGAYTKTPMWGCVLAHDDIRA